MKSFSFFILLISLKEVRWSRVAMMKQGPIPRESWIAWPGATTGTSFGMLSWFFSVDLVLPVHNSAKFFINTRVKVKWIKCDTFKFCGQDLRKCRLPRNQTCLFTNHSLFTITNRCQCQLSKLQENVKRFRNKKSVWNSGWNVLKKSDLNPLTSPRHWVNYASFLHRPRLVLRRSFRVKGRKCRDSGMLQSRVRVSASDLVRCEGQECTSFHKRLVWVTSDGTRIKCETTNQKCRSPAHLGSFSKMER